MLKEKQKRVRCSDKKFLEAVYNSKTYDEISEKTGQKVASTIARYNKLRKKNISIPIIERKKTNQSINMADIVSKLKTYCR